MPALKENALTLLSSDTYSLINAGGPHSLYTIPAGKKCLVTDIVFNNPSTTCAACTDINVGSTGTTALSWWDALDLSALVDTVDGCIVVRGPETQEAQQQLFLAGDVFQLTIITGAVGAANTRVDVFGYQYDA